jgi:uncharacterized protein YjbI with pentapeptide repeats
MEFKIACAEWGWENPEPQKFKAYDGFVIAVGSENKPEIVQASDIEDALRKGKEIRLKNAKIEGKLSFLPPIIPFKQAIYFIHTTFLGEIDFHEITFTKEANFRKATFREVANFRKTTFSEAIDFRLTSFEKGANFEETTFKEAANFSYIEHFSGEANFHNAVFKKETNFVEVPFTVANFIDAKFFGKANFRNATFSELADFRNANFSDEADFFNNEFSGEDIRFMEAIFIKEANFAKAAFTAGADFRLATFSGKANFNRATFSEAVDLSYAEFLEKVDFYDATFAKRADFSEVLFPEADFRYAQFLGEIPFSEPFYKARIKSYQDFGMWNEADNDYHTYRLEKRKQQPNPVRRVAELILLQIPFGYGVKPWNLLYTFLIVWLLPSSYYFSLLSYSDAKKTIIEKILDKSSSFTRHEYLGLLVVFVHSLNTIIPFKLDSLVNSLHESSRYVFLKKRWGFIWVESVQKVLSWYLLILFGILFGKIWIR